MSSPPPRPNPHRRLRSIPHESPRGRRFAFPCGDLPAHPERDRPGLARNVRDAVLNSGQHGYRGPAPATVPASRGAQGDAREARQSSVMRTRPKDTRGIGDPWPAWSARYGRPSYRSLEIVSACDDATGRDNNAVLHPLRQPRHMRQLGVVTIYGIAEYRNCRNCRRGGGYDNSAGFTITNFRRPWSWSRTRVSAVNSARAASRRSRSRTGPAF